MGIIACFHSISKETSRTEIFGAPYGKNFYSIQTKKTNVRVSIITCEYS